MRRRQKKRLFKLILLCFICVCVPIVIIRGCILAFSGTESTEEEAAVSKGPLLSVSDDGDTRYMYMEEYLVGVVAAEMPSSFEPSAIEAQCVAARTYALRRLDGLSGGACSTDCDVCTDSGCCQAYTDPSALPAEAKAKIESALDKTRGVVAMYDGEVIEALFHSTAGGRTEDSENAFTTALPYLRGVESDETDAPRYANSLTMAREEFAKKVNDAYHAKLDADKLETQVKVLNRFESGRIESVELGEARITGRELRALFSLDSTNADFKFGASSVTINTKGFGHGVGMSQTGANDMAKRGAAYGEILEYYYTGIELEKRW